MKEQMGLFFLFLLLVLPTFPAIPALLALLALLATALLSRYALLAGCHNLGGTIASSCGALMLQHLGVNPNGGKNETKQFDKLWIASLMSSVRSYLIRSSSTSSTFVYLCLYPLAPLQVVVGGPIVRFVTGPTTSKSVFDWKALLRHDIWLWCG